MASPGDENWREQFHLLHSQKEYLSKCPLRPSLTEEGYQMLVVLQALSHEDELCYSDL